MSAFAVAIGGKADMAWCTAYVRLWPKADIDRHQKTNHWRLATKAMEACL